MFSQSPEKAPAFPSFISTDEAHARESASFVPLAGYDRFVGFFPNHPAVFGKGRREAGLSGPDHIRDLRVAPFERRLRRIRTELKIISGIGPDSAPRAALPPGAIAQNADVIPAKNMPNTSWYLCRDYTEYRNPGKPASQKGRILPSNKPSCQGTGRDDRGRYIPYSFYSPPPPVPADRARLL